MAEEVKFTPGPWAYRPARFDDWGFVRAQPLPGENLGHLVAVAKDSSIPFDAHDAYRARREDPYEANARLIAAAPELLEACREALHYISDIDNAHRTVKQLRAVIVKATTP